MTNFLIGERYTYPQNKPAYVWPTHSTQKCEKGCVFAKMKPQSIISTALSKLKM